MYIEYPPILVIIGTLYSWLERRGRIWKDYKNLGDADLCSFYKSDRLCVLLPNI